ncbi:hypothetical protein GCM10025771_09030 [Niveibacterium umoris]|uniref:Uncharacterized protein n=1 Tax=Niveibacterium umoris TaxID=1193620 RepID=A0A840BPU9_9RHOO|nr:hypothetical protein [Niveibacterium umoris]MBB4013548.1 hypothetical protein [Niveibacterium umoris]
MNESRPSQTPSTRPAYQSAPLLELWRDRLEDTPVGLQAEAGRFSPEPWQLTPAERSAPPG